MPRAVSALVLGLALVQTSPAIALDPERTGQEAREDLKELLEKQRRDRNNPEARSDAPKPASTPPRQLPTTTGSDLPTVCIGCGAN